MAERGQRYGGRGGRCSARRSRALKWALRSYALMVWLAMGEIGPLLVGLAVVVTGPAEPFFKRLPWWPQSDGGMDDGARHGVRLSPCCSFCGPSLYEKAHSLRPFEHTRMISKILAARRITSFHFRQGMEK